MTYAPVRGEGALTIAPRSATWSYPCARLSVAGTDGWGTFARTHGDLDALTVGAEAANEKKAVIQVLLKMIEYGGPLLYHGGEAEQTSFDSTCRRFRQTLREGIRVTNPELVTTSATRPNTSTATGIRMRYPEFRRKNLCVGSGESRPDAKR